MIIDQLDKKCHYPLKNGEHYIYDNNESNQPDFVNEDKKWSLKIVNNTNDNVDFFQNDSCLMIQKELKKCDWISIFKNTFYFIEAKDVKSGRRKKQRNEAKKQLEQTILYYLENYPSIGDMNLIVIINFRNQGKITRADNKAKALFFKEEYNADYIETNYLDFN